MITRGPTDLFSITDTKNTNAHGEHLINVRAHSSPKEI